MKRIIELANKVGRTKPYENLNSILGEEMGESIYELIETIQESEPDINRLESIRDNAEDLRSRSMQQCIDYLKPGVATVFENSPLALTQLAVKSKLNACEEILDWPLTSYEDFLDIYED